MYFSFQGYKLQAWHWDASEETNIERRVINVPPSLLDPLAEQSAVMGGLDKYTAYNVSVVCFTDPGDGERSDFVFVITDQDGKTLLHLPSTFYPLHICDC